MGSGLSPDVAIRALDRAGDIMARGDVELAEDAAQVGLDGLDAEEERGGDLEVRAAVDDEARDLALALGELLNAVAVERPRPCAAVHVLAQLAELLLGLLAIADRAARIELPHGALEFAHRARAFVRPAERSTGERAGARGVHAGADLFGPGGGGERPLGGDLGLAAVQGDGGGGAVRHGGGEGQAELAGGCGRAGGSAI